MWYFSIFEYLTGMVAPWIALRSTFFPRRGDASKRRNCYRMLPIGASWIDQFWI
jgi:hypothetical protein